MLGFLAGVEREINARMSELLMEKPGHEYHVGSEVLGIVSEPLLLNLVTTERMGRYVDLMK
jgi:hypothetical protein